MSSLLCGICVLGRGSGLLGDISLLALLTWLLSSYGFVVMRTVENWPGTEPEIYRVDMEEVGVAFGSSE